MEKAIEEGLVKSEETIVKELAAGKNVFPFSEALVMAVIDISKLRSIDELIEEVSKIYEERRAKVNGLEITDDKVV